MRIVILLILCRVTIQAIKMPDWKDYKMPNWKDYRPKWTGYNFKKPSDEQINKYKADQYDFSKIAMRRYIKITKAQFSTSYFKCPFCVFGSCAICGVRYHMNIVRISHKYAKRQVWGHLPMANIEDTVKPRLGAELAWYGDYIRKTHKIWLMYEWIQAMNQNIIHLIFEQYMNIGKLADPFDKWLEKNLGVYNKKWGPTYKILP